MQSESFQNLQLLATFDIPLTFTAPAPNPTPYPAFVSDPVPAPASVHISFISNLIQVFLNFKYSNIT